MPRKVCTLAAVTLVCMLSSLAAGPEIYGPSGITPDAVKQGSLGSCYFHSAVAAIANASPELLKRAIQSDAKGNWKVTFADGKTENVYPNDVQYARDSRFDRSDGLWVSILFRAYAQRTMREALLAAVGSSDFPALIKSTGTSYISSSDLLLTAYDRAVRAAINQNGEINRQILSTELDHEMAALSIPQRPRKTFLDMLASKGFFDVLVTKLQANGELFGAYRAVGQGGIPESVLAAFTGRAKGYPVNSSDVQAVLRQAQEAHRAITASTGASLPANLAPEVQNANAAKNWYLDSHAYTVLAFDLQRRMVTLRNPWGDHPAPNGAFTIPLDVFTAAYEQIAVSDNAPASK